MGALLEGSVRCFAYKMRAFWSMNAGKWRGLGRGFVIPTARNFAWQVGDVPATWRRVPACLRQIVAGRPSGPVYAIYHNPGRDLRMPPIDTKAAPEEDRTPTSTKGRAECCRR